MSLAFSMVACAISVLTFVFNIVIPEKFRDPVLRAKRRIEALEDLKKSVPEDREDRDKFLDKFEREIKVERVKEYAYMRSSAMLLTAYFECVIFILQVEISFFLLSYHYCFHFVNGAQYCVGKAVSGWKMGGMLCFGTFLASLGIIAIVLCWNIWIKRASDFINGKREGLKKILRKVGIVWALFFVLNVVCIILVVYLREADVNWDYVYSLGVVVVFIISLTLPVWIVYNAASKQVECMVLEQDRKSLEK